MVAMTAIATASSGAKQHSRAIDSVVRDGGAGRIHPVVPRSRRWGVDPTMAAGPTLESSRGGPADGSQMPRVGLTLWATHDHKGLGWHMCVLVL